MTRTPSGDQATITLSVAVSPAVAFDIFTRETDSWWRRGPQYRFAGRERGSLQFEAHEGGRLFEQYETADGPRLVEVGVITTWDRPARLVFTWRNTNFVAGESTEVEVSFEAAPSGTLITVQHRGWSSLRPDHPARHGLAAAAFSRMMGIWWAGLLEGLRERLSSMQARDER